VVATALLVKRRARLSALGDSSSTPTPAPESAGGGASKRGKFAADRAKQQSKRFGFQNPMWELGKSARNLIPGGSGFGSGFGAGFGKSARNLFGMGGGNQEGLTAASGPASDNPMHAAGAAFAASSASVTGSGPGPASSASASMTDMAVHTPLPRGWFEAVDPGSGNTYFYNDVGDTSWVRPTVSIV